MHSCPNLVMCLWSFASTMAVASWEDVIEDAWFQLLPEQIDGPDADEMVDNVGGPGVDCSEGG